jgi:EAL domain-containing protein (putative c-di-GMP-specific phosphodiesterase class I)
MSVNISTMQFYQTDFVEVVKSIVTATGIKPEHLELELTESVCMNDVLSVNNSLKELHDFGIKIAIDDFGTGYSSLAYLKRLPVHELKIDKSFVLNMEKNDSDATIVKSTIDLGHNLKLKVVAEGIENVEAWQLLAKMGCDYGQGYFMGKPMPAKDYPAWLATWLDKINSDL